MDFPLTPRRRMPERNSDLEWFEGFLASTRSRRPALQLPDWPTHLSPLGGKSCGSAVRRPVRLVPL